MRIPLDRTSKTPLYLQVTDFIVDQINCQRLKPGTKLPSNRDMAFELGVSRTVVTEAYAELISRGVVVGRHGSGTYVLSKSTNLGQEGASRPNILLSPWINKLLQDNHLSRQQESEKLFNTATNKHVISFAEQGDADTFWPIEGFQKALKRVFQNHLHDAVNQHTYNSNYQPLCDTIAQILTSEGIASQPENILITSGSQQGLSLVAHVFLTPGDVALVESPTYNSAINLFDLMGVKMVGIPMDRDGMIIEKVEEALKKHKPRLIFTMPTFHRPTGVCLSGERRRKLVALASQYGCLILEDDFIGNIRLEGRAEPALKALDAAGYVIYMGSFSKIIMPGLRIGYLAAAKPLREILHSQKIVTDLGTSMLLQRALHEYMTVGEYHKHLRRIRKEHRARRDAMVTALKKYLPQAKFEIPKGGRYIWLKLPDTLSSDKLLPTAISEGVSFIPARFFYPGKGDLSYLQLNFAACSPDQIDEGIKRLGRAVQKLQNT